MIKSFPRSNDQVFTAYKKSDKKKFKRFPKTKFAYVSIFMSQNIPNSPVETKMWLMDCNCTLVLTPDNILTEEQLLQKKMLYVLPLPVYSVVLSLKAIHKLLLCFISSECMKVDIDVWLCAPCY